MRRKKTERQILLLQRTAQRAVKYLQKLKKSRGKGFYQCGSCKRLHVFKRELWEYVRYPKCNHCGEINWYIDNYTHKHWKNKTGTYAICNCKFVHYTHKPRSLPACEANYTQENESVNANEPANEFESFDENTFDMFPGE